LERKGQRAPLALVSPNAACNARAQGPAKKDEGMRSVWTAALTALLLAACSDPPTEAKPAQDVKQSAAAPAPPAPRAAPPVPARVDWRARAQDTRLPFAERLSAAAMERLSHRVVYDPEYLRISYPMGDVPATQGVCTDEVVRAYRTLGIDLQQLVHEDMKANFALYPKRWGLPRPDTNIDHRRVPNLQVFFARKGAKRQVTQNGEDYKAGDIVTWMLPGNLPHIGIATARRSADGKRPLIVHNIGRGPQLEDMLFSYRITGRYVYPKPS
jgi:uncharacterized protein